MSRKQKVLGVCHLCGTHGPLSYEHVPPKAAFNDHSVLEADIEKLIGQTSPGEKEKPSGRTNQKGAGGFTLCEDCNNNTGSWYGTAYVDFARRMMSVAHQCPSDHTAHIQIRTKPLNVLKQLLTMFCSACPPDFSKKNPRLVRYLLNKESQDFPSGLVTLGISLFDIHNSSASRQSEITGMMNLEKGGAIYSEICFPPFNAVMSLQGGFPDSRLFEITWFARHAFGQTSDVDLRLASLPVNTYIPGVYGRP